MARCMYPHFVGDHSIARWFDPQEMWRLGVDPSGDGMEGLGGLAPVGTLAAALEKIERIARSGRSGGGGDRLQASYTRDVSRAASTSPRHATASSEMA